ncbi:MAG: tRNA uridine-5-carboxymethylaminomethyl(34) synthesis GTPase MnmE [Elusimicrobia bacterium RIFOXYA2_FULL_39_19]|nr:MAG: tRNA uridine-5-carboxymethylaminomethyl(34) synthesis GTPase MnmE [Elusimicrobia bacterium RIFOXYA2_FULL_39_19]
MKLAQSDTIAAIATSNTGEGGIGIVRLSGTDAVKTAEKIFLSKNNKELSGFKSHTVHYGWITDGKNKIDEVLLTVMRAPKTYTCEDVVEISGHGGPAVLRKILELCLKSGARISAPGEFTKRAFLNGRIDLAQAEAVCNLIRAKTDKSAVLAVAQINGSLSQKIKDFRSKLINLTANIEASLDYSEEDIKIISKEEIVSVLEKSNSEMKYIINSSQKNKVYIEGIKAAIVGRPNVGKSSLFNAILEKERAIVAPLPGTTRDIITETFNLKDIPVTILDTAGIMMKYLDNNLQETKEIEKYIDKVSTQKAKDIISEADIVLFVIDISTELSKEDTDIARIVAQSGKKTILVLNKTDLLNAKTAETAVKKSAAELDKILHNHAVVQCSAHNSDKVTSLEEAIYAKILEELGSLKAPDTQESAYVVNLRQEQSLNKAVENISLALISAGKNESGEFIVLHLRSALDALGEIIGETTTEDILDEIFSNFCVGK